MTKRLDLCLIHPGSRKQVYQALGEKLSAVEPPVWAGLLATFARKKGFSVAVLDAEAENLSAAEVGDRIAEMDPMLATVVVYGHQPSASTQNMTASGEICRALRERAPKVKSLLLGGHVSSLPQRTLEEEEADFVATGEGPHTLVELLSALREGEEQLGKVRGLGYRREGKGVFTPPAPLVADLDAEMGAMAWDLLPIKRYRAHNWHCFGHLEREPYASIYTTLGCPFKCTFCCIQAPFKAGEKLLGLKETTNSYRFWSPEAVLAQIDVLVREHGVRNLKIADEMFVLNQRHVERVCDLILERGYELNIWAYARVDTVKPALLDKLRRAGFRWLAFGIEAASERVRDDVQKGFDQDDVHRTIDEVRRAGIYVIGNYIFGLPEDDLASMQATLDLALALNCEFGNFYCAMAYPGSQLYQLAQQRGWSLPKRWSGYSQHSVDSLPLPTNHLSASEVLRFRDQAFSAYFKNARYLEMVERTFGPATVAHIGQMTAHKLERKFA